MTTDEKHFVDWERHVFGYGYGTGEMPILEALKSFMASLENERSYDHKKLEELLGPLGAWLLINVLAHADIIEYGTSPRYGWLTKKGEALRRILFAKTTDELYDLVMSADMDHVQCFPDLCQCDKPCKNPLFGLGE